MISSNKIIEEYKNGKHEESFIDQWPTLYMYALYVCGGDFSQFDDIDAFTEVQTEPQNSEEKPMICVLCGTPWGVKNQFTNVCENPECSGFCSWGHEMNNPLSFSVQEDGKWIPNHPFSNQAEDPKEYRKQIRDGNYEIVKKYFDLDVIFNFCQEHRVEILLQEDTMFHCYIDYHLDEGKKGVWAVEFDGFTCMVRGITDYIKHNGVK